MNSDSFNFFFELTSYLFFFRRDLRILKRLITFKCVSSGYFLFFEWSISNSQKFTYFVETFSNVRLKISNFWNIRNQGNFSWRKHWKLNIFRNIFYFSKRMITFQSFPTWSNSIVPIINFSLARDINYQEIELTVSSLQQLYTLSGNHSHDTITQCRWRSPSQRSASVDPFFGYHHDRSRFSEILNSLST